jgi:UDP-N-acetylglucosamine 2-epimerase (non-hydrolysing)
VKTVAFVVGTTAEIIKISGVAKELSALGVRFEIWSTQQQAGELDDTLSVFFTNPSTTRLSKSSKSLAKKSHVIPWIANNLYSVFKLKSSRAGSLPEAIVVQGDTLSTVIGAIAGRVLSLPVVHIEAGLRSGDWRNPFPEEMNRRVVSRIARLHLAPNFEAAKNLFKHEGIVVNTFGNTGVDALRDMQQSVESRNYEYLENKTNVTVVLHRTELLSKKDVFADTISFLEELALEFNVTMTLDIPSSRALSELKNSRSIENLKNLNSVSKLNFPDFVELLARADFVITDSGGLQEECAILGIPCFIHREVSERLDGIGENAELTGMSVVKLRELTNNWEQYRRPTRWPTSSPSKVSAHAILEILN